MEEAEGHLNGDLRCNIAWCHDGLPLELESMADRSKHIWGQFMVYMEHRQKSGLSGVRGLKSLNTNTLYSKRVSKINT